MIVRKATSDDALEVWAWRNDPLTREMSKNRNEVSRASHLYWFTDAVEDLGRTILIGEADCHKVGMVRFDHGHATEVSINVNPEFRSRGYGHPLLMAALRWAPDDVWAEIRDENLASQRLFERAGFRLQGTSDGLRRYFRPSD